MSHETGNVGSVGHLIDRAIARRARASAPGDLAESIVTSARETPQQRAFGVAARTWLDLRPAVLLALIGIVLLAALGATIVGGGSPPRLIPGLNDGGPATPIRSPHQVFLQPYSHTVGPPLAISFTLPNDSSDAWDGYATDYRGVLGSSDPQGPWIEIWARVPVVFAGCQTAAKSNPSLSEAFDTISSLSQQPAVPIAFAGATGQAVDVDFSGGYCPGTQGPLHPWVLSGGDRNNGDYEPPGLPAAGKARFELVRIGSTELLIAIRTQSADGFADGLARADALLRSLRVGR